MGRRSKCCKFSWFVNDGVGIGCAIFTYLLIGYAEFVVVFVMLLPEVVRAAAFGLFHATAFTFFACLALVAHSRAMCSDPGSIPLGNCTSENLKKLQLKEGEVVLRCTRCECIKLDRAHHCSVECQTGLQGQRGQLACLTVSHTLTCERCIRKMDHHCPWINNCVGEDNQKFFVLFTLYIFTISVYALALTIRQLFICTEKEWQDCTFLPIASAILLMIFLVFEGLLFGIFTLVMFCTQVSSIVKDETGIENLKKERVSRKNTVYENLQDVFGGYFSVSWFSPFSSGPSRRASYAFHDV